ncbi:MAG: hypothetical protein HUU57_14130 [Bdellovibrio sp.]|nr:hypothetical protein [Bdellovibrio sp.]
MRKIISCVVIALISTSSAMAADTLVFAFNKDRTYIKSVTSRGGTPYGTRPCTDFNNITDAPDSCFSRTYVQVAEVAQLQEVKNSYEAKILSLENRINAYKDQIASNHRDIIETIVGDPQFRSLLAKKLKADAQR